MSTDRRRTPVRRRHFVCALFLRRRAAASALLFAATLFSTPAAGQDLLLRTPNLSGGWVAAPGALAFTFDHRFWSVPSEEGRAVINSPTFLLGIPLGGEAMVAGRYATRGPVGIGKIREWELFGRWAPRVGPIEAALTGGYNGQAESLDAELSAGITHDFSEEAPLRGFRLIGVGRLLSDALGAGEMGWFVGGGVVLRVRDRLSLSGDFGTLESDGADPKAVWGAGAQLRIAGSPHTVSLFAANAQTATMQGASAGGRTVWGFEFTIPARPGNFLP